MFQLFKCRCSLCRISAKEFQNDLGNPRRNTRRIWRRLRRSRHVLRSETGAIGIFKQMTPSQYAVKNCAQRVQIALMTDVATLQDFRWTEVDRFIVLACRSESTESCVRQLECVSRNKDVRRLYGPVRSAMAR